MGRPVSVPEDRPANRALSGTVRLIPRTFDDGGNEIQKIRTSISANIQ